MKRWLLEIGGVVGLFRKAVSVSTLGVVSYRSSEERQVRSARQTAKYDKQARNAARAQVAQNAVDLQIQRAQLEAVERQAGIVQAQLEEQIRVQHSYQPAEVAPHAVPAGWYPVEGRPGAFMWWDGQRWHEPTLHYR